MDQKNGLPGGGGPGLSMRGVLCSSELDVPDGLGSDTGLSLPSNLTASQTDSELTNNNRSERPNDPTPAAPSRAQSPPLHSPLRILADMASSTRAAHSKSVISRYT